MSLGCLILASVYQTEEATLEIMSQALGLGLMKYHDDVYITSTVVINDQGEGVLLAKH